MQDFYRQQHDSQLSRMGLRPQVEILLHVEILGALNATGSEWSPNIPPETGGLLFGLFKSGLEVSLGAAGGMEAVI